MIVSHVLSTLAVSGLLLSAPGMSAGANGQPVRLRIPDPHIRRVVNDAVLRSITLRRLIDEIEQSDLIVHVVLDHCAAEVDGAMRLAAVSGGARFVRVSIRRGVPRAALAALIGHELAHVVEVARDPRVRDQESMRMLYERIGYRIAAGNRRFDTTHAVATGLHVQQELQARTRAAAVE